jgi:hypothetical protein
MDDDEDDVKVWVTISPDAHAAVAACARREFESEAAQLPDGNWTVPIRPDTMRRLVAHQFPGETIGDTILRVCLTAKHPLQ